MSRKALGWSIVAGVAIVGAVVGVVVAYTRGPSYTHRTTVPPPPQAVQATAGDKAATVSWSAPSYSSGALMAVEYVVVASPGGASCSSVARSCTVTGLRNGRSYTFTVVAHDSAGASAPATSNAVTPSASAHGGGSGPRLAVSPASGLANGQTVSVSGSGFTPGDQVFLVECLVGATGQGGCDVSTATPVTVSASGQLPATSFSVVTGAVGTGACGTTPSNRAACAISAGNAQGGDSAVAPISFQ